MDPSGSVADAKIWRVLQIVQLKKLVLDLPDQLGQLNFIFVTCCNVGASLLAYCFDLRCVSVFCSGKTSGLLRACFPVL